VTKKMPPDTTKPNSSLPKSRMNRAGKAVLSTSAGVIPLAISLIAGTVGNRAVTSHVPAQNAEFSRSDVVFNPGCGMPFKSDPIPDIDNQCSIDGAGKTEEKIVESRAKNDFCAETSDPIAIDYQTFVDLQKGTSFRGSADRSPLASILSRNGVTIGEGKFVEYAGFVLHAQYSNRSKGEAVNCNIPGEDTNDIHIQMVADPSDDDACDSVTAEMSPHFRPDAWTPDKLNSLQDHLIRIRGPLFFDGSHTPCHDGKRPNPQRISVWEIHPVYSVDVCKEKGIKCQDFVSLDEWNGVESEED
jgi:hypothetical protein